MTDKIKELEELTTRINNLLNDLKVQNSPRDIKADMPATGHYYALPDSTWYGCGALVYLESETNNGYRGVVLKKDGIVFNASLPYLLVFGNVDDVSGSEILKHHRLIRKGDP